MERSERIYLYVFIVTPNVLRIHKNNYSAEFSSNSKIEESNPSFLNAKSSGQPLVELVTYEIIGFYTTSPKGEKMLLFSYMFFTSSIVLFDYSLLYQKK